MPGVYEELCYVLKDTKDFNTWNLSSISFFLVDEIYMHTGNFLVVKILPSNEGGKGLVPGQGGKSHVPPAKKPKHKTEQYCNKFNKGLKCKHTHTHMFLLDDLQVKPFIIFGVIKYYKKYKIHSFSLYLFSVPC